jgi:uncharacterized RDD family membrane protein YckC
VSDFTSYPREASEREAELRPQSPAHEYASWGSRVAAFLLDGLIVFAIVGIPVVIVVVAILASTSEPERDGGGLAVAMIVVVYLVALALPFVYYTVLQGGARGATWGTRALGIRVVHQDGQALGYGRAFGRYGIQLLLGILVLPLLADYLWPLWDAKNQSLHDKVVGSVVVRT